MNEKLLDEVRTALGLALAAAEGEGLAARVLQTGDSKAQLRRLLQRLSEDETSPEPHSGAVDHAPGDNVTHLIVRQGDGETRSTLSYIRSWLRGSKRVTICDPYFLQPPRSASFTSEDHYVEAVVSLLPASAERVDIFCDGFKHSIRRSFARAAKEGRAELRIFVTSDIHDRFVLREDDVKIVGTSFGGFGNKLFAVLDLSERDCEMVREQLTAIRAKASRQRFQRQGQNDGSAFV